MGDLTFGKLVKFLGAAVVIICVLFFFRTCIGNILMANFKVVKQQSNILVRFPSDFVETTGDENIMNYPMSFLSSGFDNGVIYGYDKSKIYYRLMWMKTPYAALANEHSVLKKYVELFKADDSFLVPVLNRQIKIENGKYKLLKSETLWPYVSGQRHDLLLFKRTFAGKDGKKIIDWTTVWYCGKTQRLISATMESYDSDYKMGDNWGFFVAYTDCHNGIK